MITDFENVEEGSEFLFECNGQLVTFIKRKGVSYENGPMKPIDYNAIYKGKGWVFDDKEEVLVV